MEEISKLRTESKEEKTVVYTDQLDRFNSQSNEVININLNNVLVKSFLKPASNELVQLEQYLLDENIDKNFHSIVQLIDNLSNDDLFVYKNEESQESLLHQLIHNGAKKSKNNDVIYKLFCKFVDRGCNINAIDSYSWTILHYCCVYNMIDLVDYIINHQNFNKNILDAQTAKQLKTDTLYYLIGTTPIQICAWLNHLPICKKIVDYGANIHIKNDAGWTCLHIVARQAYEDFIKYLITIGANVNEGNNHEKTPLHVSCRHGHLDITKVLLDSGADLKLVNNYGQSPLYVAVTRAHYDIVKLLIDYGADVNQPDKQQNIPLHAAALLKEATNPLKSSKNKNVQATSTNLVNVMIGELLVSRDANLMKLNYLGRTPLHYAAKNNCSEFVTLLITKAPLCINIRDIYGETALYIACKWESFQVVDLLLAKKSNKDISDLSGRSPLHLCGTLEDSETSKLLISTLLDHGDDVNKTLVNTFSNETPLHIASKVNNSKIIKFLISKDADVNKTTNDGKTPLHLASENGSYESCMELLDGGAKINKTTKLGHTTLHSSILAVKHSSNIASLLIDYGVSINQEDNENITPLAMATLNGNFAVVDLLIQKKAKILNSKNDSVAHVCALKNRCDAKCLKLLIDDYSFNSLFQYSITNYKTPLQMCVEKRSNEFLKSLISCHNIHCIEWFTKLHSKKGFNVSPMVMAVTSQNYEFIQQLINMWFELFHDTHHSGIEDLEEFSLNINVFQLIKNRVQGMFKSRNQTPIQVAPHDFDASINNRRSTIIRIKPAHGCRLCTHDNICLFKPNWDDDEQDSGKYFLNILIIENPQLTLQILDTFMKTDVLRWQTYLYLDHLEPCENISKLKNSYERPFTPLETIFLFGQTELVTHPVVKTLIDIKMNSYSTYPLLFDMIRQVCMLAVWTAFACCEDYSIRHCYVLSNRIGKIILVVLCVLLFLWDILDELRSIYFIYRRMNGEYKWTKNKCLEENLELTDLVNDTKGRMDQIKKQKVNGTDQYVYMSPIEKQRRKYLLIRKSARLNSNIVSPYKRGDNIMDWISLIIQIVTLVTHFIDISRHTDDTARLHIIIATINVIVIWLRELLIVNGLIPAANLVCMLRLMGMDILRYLFLFVRIYIPFVLLYWALYSGQNRTPENVMSIYWRECEYINYGVPYTGPYNITTGDYSSIPVNCTQFVNIDGLDNFFTTLYSVFRLIVVDFYDFDNMRLVQYILTPTICSIFIILSAIIGLNFFIGLISNILSEGAFQQVESHKSMELLGYVLQHEWRLSINARQKHLDMIKDKCSPKILKYDSQLLSSLNSKKSKTYQQSRTYAKKQETQNLNKQNDEMNHELNDLKAELKEIKSLLKASLGARK